MTRDGAATSPQSARHVLMVRPAAFARNEVTRPTNHFQADELHADSDAIARAAVAEFNSVVATLVARGIGVQMFEGHRFTPLPDEVFPNNWISTHDDGTVVLYPLCAWNRREERRRDIVDDLQRRADSFRIERIVDLSILETRNHYLEGTGSLVLDRRQHIVYACRSARTHAEALHVFTQKMHYSPVFFDAFDAGGQAVYHTNVLMSLGERFAVVCTEAVADVKDRYRILKRLEDSGREIVEITTAQMHAFAGNVLELDAPAGRLIVMSTTAARAFTDEQTATLMRHGELVAVNVGTIEKYGGGGVRCMLAEIFLPPK